MNLIDIKNYSKKSKASLYLKLIRKIGVYFTWLTLKVYPKITPNIATVVMMAIASWSIILNIIFISSGNIIYLIASCIIFNIAMIYDCVDGNIARIKNMKSYYGVFLDRVSHNVINFIFILSIGYIVYYATNNINVFLLFLFSAILYQLNPFQVSALETFYLFSKSNDDHYDVSSHVMEDVNKKNKQYKSLYNYKQRLKDIASLFPLWNKYYIIIIIDNIYSLKYILTILFTCLIIIKYLIETFQYFKYRGLVQRV